MLFISPNRQSMLKVIPDGNIKYHTRKSFYYDSLKESGIIII